MKIDEIITKFSEAESEGMFIHADKNHVKDTIQSLLDNEERYGYMVCPCRLASGVKEEDADIICPCLYREDDVKEFGACYCLLFVSEEHKDNPEFYPEIDERRPA